MMKTLLANLTAQMSDHFALFGMAMQTPLSTRIVEAGVIAIVTGFLTSQLTANAVTARLEERIAAQSTRLTSLERQITEHSIEDMKIRERIATCEALQRHK